MFVTTVPQAKSRYSFPFSSVTTAPDAFAATISMSHPSAGVRTFFARSTMLLMCLPPLCVFVRAAGFPPRRAGTGHLQGPFRGAGRSKSLRARGLPETTGGMRAVSSHKKRSNQMGDRSSAPDSLRDLAEAGLDPGWEEPKYTERVRVVNTARAGGVAPVAG